MIEIISKALSELIPYDKNPRKISEEAVNAVAESIQEFGFKNPILIDKDNVIIAGHTRRLASLKLGLERVPCVVVDDLTPQQIKALRLADNKTNELADWDIGELDLELADLLDMDMERFGFELPEMDEPTEVVEDEIPEEVETRCKLGDIWRLGDHRLMCGDSTNIESVARLMDGAKADIVFTDPPWNVNYGAVEKGNEQGYKPRTILNDFMGTEEFKQFMISAFKCMNEASKNGAMTYVVMSAQEWGNLMLALASNDYHWSSTIIWAKDTLVLSRKDYHTQYEPIWYGWKDGSRLHPLKDRKQSDVWNIPRPKRSDEHPTMKPIELVARALTNSSNCDDIALDLFGGSGTTLIASEQTKRRCYMMELDPHYCDVIIARWENLTGEKAKKEEQDV